MTANRPEEDPLIPVLAHFNARANVFFTGNLCTHVDFNQASGYLHLLRSGKTELRDATGYQAILAEPSLIFYSRPLSHWFDPDPVRGADLACATVSFDHMAFNPIAQALPARFECRLTELDSAGRLIELLFAEAFAEHPGRQEVLNRLFEIVLIELLRASIRRGDASAGFLRGFAHAQLRKTLTAIHAEPGRAWTLEAMAEAAGMSRSSFAQTFKEEVGETPGDYLARWRVAVAQALLKRGTPLKHVAGKVGYASHAGFLRAFKSVIGVSPTSWQRN
jgi:AraC-like DNA-binding protein